MFRITDQTIDGAALRREVERPAAGACVTFEGWVRDHNEGRSVASLEYEAYQALAEKEGARILDEALERFDILAVAAVHRTGHLQIGEMAVWVGVSSAHRDAAFAASRYVIDELKHRVPIWKREHYTDGDAHWVDCTACAAAASREHVH